MESKDDLSRFMMSVDSNSLEEEERHPRFPIFLNESFFPEDTEEFDRADALVLLRKEQYIKKRIESVADEEQRILVETEDEAFKEFLCRLSFPKDLLWKYIGDMKILIMLHYAIGYERPSSDQLERELLYNHPQAGMYLRTFPDAVRCCRTLENLRRMCIFDTIREFVYASVKTNYDSSFAFSSIFTLLGKYTVSWELWLYWIATASRPVSGITSEMLFESVLDSFFGMFEQWLALFPFDDVLPDRFCSLLSSICRNYERDILSEALEHFLVLLRLPFWEERCDRLFLDLLKLSLTYSPSNPLPCFTDILKKRVDQDEDLSANLFESACFHSVHYGGKNSFRPMSPLKVSFQDSFANIMKSEVFRTYLDQYVYFCLKPAKRKTGEE